jgi:hypothetical protein
MSDKSDFVTHKVLDHLDGGAWKEAKALWDEYCKDMENEEILECWEHFDSKQRAWLKGDDRRYIDEFLES